MSRLAYLPWAVGVVLMAYMVSVEYAFAVANLTYLFVNRAFWFGYNGMARLRGWFTLDPR